MLSDRLFSHADVTMGGERYLVSLSCQQRALTVGDLAILWGSPQRVSIQRAQIYLHWPDYTVSAVVSFDGRFSYFLPIERVIFVKYRISVDSGNHTVD
jgi:hypothetical protein